MMNRKAFFDGIRPMFGGTLTQAQVDGIEALLSATATLPVSYRAYLLATAKRETDHTMQPIAEYGKGRGRPYGKIGKYRQVPYGRGYVQITWDANYEKADAALGLDGALLRDFDLALQPTIAALILVRGCLEGWFTGLALDDFLPGDYVGARKVVNGTDKAELIAGYARVFEKALTAALVDQPLATNPVVAQNVPDPVIKGFWSSLFEAIRGIITGRAA